MFTLVTPMAETDLLLRSHVDLTPSSSIASAVLRKTSTLFVVLFIRLLVNIRPEGMLRRAAGLALGRVVAKRAGAAAGRRQLMVASPSILGQVQAAAASEPHLNCFKMHTDGADPVLYAALPAPAQARNMQSDEGIRQALGCAILGPGVLSERASGLRAKCLKVRGGGGAWRS